MKYYQFARLIGEIIPRLEGARAQKVFQPGDFCVQVELYTGERTEYLTVRTRPGQVALYLAAARSGARGEAASDLAMKLRSRLSGAVCVKAAQAPGDRVLRLDFHSAAGESVVVIELFGIGGNLYLLDEQGKVAAVLDHKAASSRNLLPGAGYGFPEPPPETSSAPTGKLDPIAQLCEKEGLESYNRAAELYYEQIASGDSLERDRAGVRRVLSRRRKRLQKLLDDFRMALDQADKADWYRECGEILAANFKNVSRGQSHVRLPDFYAAKQDQLRDIPLVEKLPPQHNMERYFRKSRKLKCAAAYALEHMDRAERDLNRVVELEASLEKAESREELEQVARDAGLDSVESSGRSRGRKTQERRQPYRKFTAADGSVIMVGRGDRDNNELTFKIANGRDLWLHAADSAGSHVVLVCGREGNWSHEALLDAAQLAAHYSSLKGEPAVDVSYTRRKHLSRPPNAAPGLVTMADRKTIRVRIDRKRLARLHEKD
ncbi:MAG: DUF814 domain-containing protein [Candidatus Glassbacteria bacterium]|nr:DUF814 domain-containing protein [Candidatus Glassbacteria bacterium]